MPWVEVLGNDICRLHALLRHSQYLGIEGAPHNVYYEAAAYNDAVDTFLTQVAR